jgi:hypothetical protein
MTWTKLDDLFWMNPKVLLAGNTAAGAFARMLSYCGCYLTDGLVPQGIADTIAGADTDSLQRLIDVGLVTRLESGGIYIADYLEHNRSKAQVEADRKQRRENGKKGGRRPQANLRSVK